MDYHKNARLTVSLREELARKVVLGKATLKLAAASFNVSAKTAAKWVHRYREHGPGGLGDRSSRPLRCPRTTSSPLLEKVLALRRLRYNGWRIARELGLSRATVSRILCRAGLNRLRSLDPPPPTVRYEHKHPGDLIHFDIKRQARPPHPRRPHAGDAGRRLRVSAHRNRRSQPHQLRRHPARPDPRFGSPLLLPDSCLLLPLRLLGPPRPHRQWVLLSRWHLPHDPEPTAHQAPLHQALYAPHQRNGRTLHPDCAPRMGLRPLLQQLLRTGTPARPLAA